MANSKYEYVKDYENHHEVGSGSWLVIRVDGHSFSNFTKVQNYRRPYDARGQGLMDHVAMMTMKEFSGVVLAYGESDEYSFVLRPSEDMFNRRETKIATTFASFFTGAFVMNWSTFFPGNPLTMVPHFDGRAMGYPTLDILKDYLAWRQVDCHKNSLSNTTYWTLVQEGNMSGKVAQNEMNHKTPAEKREIIESYGLKYGEFPEDYRHGSTLVRLIEEYQLDQAGIDELKAKNIPVKSIQTRSLRCKYEKIVVNLISDEFYQEYSAVFDDVSLKSLKEEFKIRIAREESEMKKLLQLVENEKATVNSN